MEKNIEQSKLYQGIMNRPTYIIVKSSEISDLEGRVNIKIEEHGYKPIGGHSYFKDKGGWECHCQAMIKIAVDK